MNKKEQKSKCLRFKELHHQKELLFLPNAWHAMSAKVFENHGAKAIGTTSAGMSYLLGKPDGEQLTFDELLFLSKYIIEGVELPVSVDVERGYGGESDDFLMIKEHVQQVIELGAVGINIEDGIGFGKVDDYRYFKEKLEHVIALKEELSMPFFINARLDSYLLQVGNEKSRLSETIERANLLAELGVDSVFIPANVDEKIIKQWVKEIVLPINAFIAPKVKSINHLEALGIKRLSSGSAFVRTALHDLDLQYQKVLKDSESAFQFMTSHSFQYGASNNFFNK